MEDEDLACVADPDGRKYFIKQDPLAPCTGPRAPLCSLSCQKAEMFNARDV